MSVYEIVPAEKLIAAWRRVFLATDPFAWPFTSAVEECKILYPTDGFHLSRSQYSAFINAVKSVGDEGFFLSIVESEDLSFLSRPSGHWWCEFPDYEDYCQINLALENAMFSPSFHWGVLVSHEMHALAGGSAEFMEAFAQNYPNWKEDVQALRLAWLGNPNSDWVESVIRRVAK